LFVVLATHADRGLGILFVFQGGADAGIEAARPMGRDADHSAKCTDGKSGDLSHVNLSHDRKSSSRNFI